MMSSNYGFNNSVFQKYIFGGAYHWGAISRNPRKHHPFVSARYQLCLDLLGCVIDKQVLDFGCGDGALAGLMARAGGHITGYDPNELGLDFARSQFAHHRLKGNFYSSTSHLPNDYFDIIICSEVIEHVAAPEKILGEIKRLLKHTGVAVISTPIRLTEEVHDKEHLREYFPSEFQALCENYFEIIEIRHELPVALHELLRLHGATGWLLDKSLRVLSAWFKWNYLLKIKGYYRLYAVQFAKVRSK